MSMAVYIIGSFLAGGILSWIIATLRIKSELKVEQEKTSNLSESLKSREEELRTKNEELEKSKMLNVELTSKNNSLNDQLENQKQEMEESYKRLKIEFENIATKILDEKSEKFTRQNKENLDTILKPLDEKIKEFKKKVEEVYDKESKERFSLGREIEKLVTLNMKISDDANNLTHALKGDSKIQGDWGQMILESILEKSGLVKGREYFVQEFLRDGDGNTLKSEEGKKMQPDVIVNLPDERKVIIDSKVSLTAYARYVASDDPNIQRKAIEEHLRSIRLHVDELKQKSYAEFTLALDYVMMFVPNEPAFFLALKNDPELWHYAYRKKIVLISPTNLIAVLKLTQELWKREYQNRNVHDIAERGGALYDKFVGFVEKLETIGDHIGKAKKSYDDAYSQLKDGRGNLIGQVEKLKKLGLKSKKQLPQSLVEKALAADEDNGQDGDSNDSEKFLE